MKKDKIIKIRDELLNLIEKNSYTSMLNVKTDLSNNHYLFIDDSFKSEQNFKKNQDYLKKIIGNVSLIEKLIIIDITRENFVLKNIYADMDAIDLLYFFNKVQEGLFRKTYNCLFNFKKHNLLKDDFLDLLLSENSKLFSSCLKPSLLQGVSILLEIITIIPDSKKVDYIYGVYKNIPPIFVEDVLKEFDNFLTPYQKILLEKRIVKDIENIKNNKVFDVENLSYVENEKSKITKTFSIHNTFSDYISLQDLGFEYKTKLYINEICLSINYLKHQINVELESDYTSHADLDKISSLKDFISNFLMKLIKERYLKKFKNEPLNNNGFINIQEQYDNFLREKRESNLIDIIEKDDTIRVRNEFKPVKL